MCAHTRTTAWTEGIRNGEQLVVAQMFNNAKLKTSYGEETQWGGVGEFQEGTDKKNKDNEYIKQDEVECIWWDPVFICIL